MVHSSPPPPTVGRARPASARARGRDLAARLRPLALPAGVYLVAATFLAANTARIGDWAVMTDELLYVKLASAIASTGSPVPTGHGEYYGALAQLYPLLLAPLYALLDVPTAFRAAHVLNAALFAGAAIPVYVLARTVASRLVAAAVALASVVTPWALVAGFLMTEAVAYPAFAWAALAVQRAVARPSSRADALALAAVAVAFVARTQFLVLAVVLPLAIVVHELSATAGAGGRLAAVREGLGRAAGRHRLLLLAYGVAAGAALAGAALGFLDAVLGTYSVTATEGSVLPSGVWRSAVVHLVAVAIGVGVLPLMLAVAWVAVTLVRPSGRDAHALAAVTALVVASLSLQVASYDLRFGETDLVRDRYVFYVVPLLFVGAAAALVDRPPHPLVIAAAAAAFAWTVRWYEFDVVTPFTVDSPVGLLNERLADSAGELSMGTFAAVGSALLAVAFLAARALAPPGAVVGAVLAAMVAFGALTTQDAFGSVLGSRGPSGRALTATPGEAEGWIDAALPDDADAALVPALVDSWEASAVRWWDAEFWNGSVDRAFVDDSGRFSYTPFAVDRLSVDWQSGRVRSSAGEPPFLVVATRDARFRLAGPRRGAHAGLELIAAERPYRVEWATRGPDLDGWIRPGRPATVRAFARPGAADEVVSLDVVLKAPVDADTRYRLVTGSGSRESAAAADAAVVERIDLCVPAGAFADAAILADAAARIPLPSLGRPARGLRTVGVRIEGIVIERTGTPCTAAEAG